MLDNQVEIKANAKPYKIVLVGNPTLWERSKEIKDIKLEDIPHIVDRLYATIADFGGGLGLAAPQVGVQLRLFIFHVPKHRADDGVEIPWDAAINPSFSPLSDEYTEEWEGCFSFDKLKCKVKRYNHIRYEYTNLHGEKVVGEARGMHARVFQHEMDHIDGRLISDHLEDVKNIAFHQELKKLQE